MRPHSIKSVNADEGIALNQVDFLLVSLSLFLASQTSITLLPSNVAAVWFSRADAANNSDIADRNGNVDI